MTLSIKTVFLALAIICFALKFLSVPTGRIDTFAGGFLFGLLYFVL